MVYAHWLCISIVFLSAWLIDILMWLTSYWTSDAWGVLLITDLKTNTR